TAKIVASDARPYDRFGESISLDGETLAVGAPLDDDGGSATGAVYLFSRNGGAWSEDQKLTPESLDLMLDPIASDLFGTDVDLCGDYLAVGAPGDDDNLGVNLFNTGAFCVYENAGGP